MCVIVHQPPTTYVDKKEARNMWKRNSDGAGFAFINDDLEIITDKAMNFQEFWNKFESARSANRKAEFLLHFRIATSGKVGLPNTHPFRIDEHTVMAHNGMLNRIVGQIGLDAERSDTREFINMVLSELPENWLDNPVLFDMMEDYIDGSKLMFLTTNPNLKRRVYILNAHKGTKRNGLWFSNTHHDPPPPRPAPPVRNRYQAFKVSSGRKVYDGSDHIWEQNKDGDWLKIDKRTGTLIHKVTPKNKQKGLTPNKGPSEESNIYQLPLPRNGDSGKDGHRGVTPGEAQTLHLVSEVTALRKEQGLYLDVTVDAQTGDIECTGCYETVNLISGDCGCWDMVCIDCGAIAPYCVHAPEDRNWVNVKDVEYTGGIFS